MLGLDHGDEDVGARERLVDVRHVDGHDLGLDVLLGQQAPQPGGDHL